MCRIVVRVATIGWSQYAAAASGMATLPVRALSAVGQAQDRFAAVACCWGGAGGAAAHAAAPARASTAAAIR
jgi:hypothetical protein